MDGCQALARAVCDRLLTCAPTALHYGLGTTSFSFTTLDQCRERHALACRATMALPSSSIDDAAVKGCAERVSVLPCDRLDVSNSPALTMCGWPAGKLPVGAACQHDVQCSTRLCEDTTDGAGCLRTCVATVDDGVSCKNAACKPGSICWKGVCAAFGMPGDPCTPGGDDAPCRPDLSCLRPCEGCPPRCASRLSTPTCSEPCDVFADAICDNTKASCIAVTPIKTGSGCGATQGPDGPSRYPCEPGSKCLNQNDFGSGQCRPLVADGAACDEWAGPGCVFPAACVDKVCKVVIESRCE